MPHLYDQVWWIGILAESLLAEASNSSDTNTEIINEVGVRMATFSSRIQTFLRK